eukprot:6547100-Ditylum_brightwellii.AAC.1
MCDWYGVECEDGKVVGISLDENGLKGTVPPEIFTLSGLKELDVQSNDISFDFSDLAEATSLEVLYLSRTNLQSLDGLWLA